MNCQCERVADDVTQTVLKQIERSRCHRATGLCATGADFDGVCHCNIISEEECEQLEANIHRELNPMRLVIEHEIIEEVKKNEELILRKNILKDKGIYKVGWTSITCSKEKSPQTMAKLTESLLKLKPFADCMATIEFHGGQGQYHPHIHLLYTAVQKPSHYKRDLCRKFGVDPKNKHFYDSKILKSEETIKEKELYLRGEKTDLKQNQIEKDDELRKKHNIPKFYSQGSIYNA